MALRLGEGQQGAEVLAELTRLGPKTGGLASVFPKAVPCGLAIRAASCSPGQRNRLPFQLSA